jgi:hypothetical protein
MRHRDLKLSPHQRDLYTQPMSVWGVRRENAALISGCKSHPVIVPTG